MGMSEGPEEIPPERLAELLESGEADVIDVRTDEERAAGHIPGTRHVAFEVLPGESASLDHSRLVVFYCRSGDRSKSAAEAFAASGWHAASVAGGLLAWVDEGRPLEPEDGKVVEPSGLPPA
jgi:rhodanese-related sulfurtransferase